MGTNYYVHAEPLRPSEPDAGFHLGKSSAGWQFLFADCPALGVSTYAGWREILSRPGVVLRNEYGDEITMEQLDDIVQSKRVDNAGTTGERTDPEGYRFSTAREFF